MSNNTYTTKLGDKWDSIALLQYGNKSFADKLLRANSQYMEIYIFPAGIVLTLPEVTKRGTRAALPPWKRNL